MFNSPGLSKVLADTLINFLACRHGFGEIKTNSDSSRGNRSNHILGFSYVLVFGDYSSKNVPL